MWILISGPYRTGTHSPQDRERNLRALNAAAVEVLDRGHVPVIGVNLALPVIEAAGRDRYDEIMLPLSLELSERCDAALRIGGPSEGADREVERLAARGGRIFRSLAEVPEVHHAAERCEPCAKGAPGLRADEVQALLGTVPEWALTERGDAIRREVKRKDFRAALALVQQVGDLAERAGHHPDIAIRWNRVTLTLTTHAIGALHRNDFVVAARIDALLAG